MSPRDARRDSSLDEQLFEPIETAAESSPGEAGDYGPHEGDFDLGYTEEAPAAGYVTPSLGTSNLMLCAATLSILAGIGMGAWIAVARDSVPLTLLRIGVSPTLLVLSGVVMLGLWSLGRRQAYISQQSVTALDPIYAALEGLAGELSETIAAASQPAQQSTQHALVGLQRIDEKISNLSRATKMYGKPLIEVANKVERGATMMAELETTLEKVVEQVASSSDLLASDLGKIRAALPSKDTLNAEKFEQLVVATRQSTAIVEELKTELAANPHSDDGIDAVQTAVKTVQGQIAKIAATIERLEHAPARAPAAPAAQAAQAAAAPQRPAAPAAPAAAAAPAAPAPAPKNDSGLATSIAGKRKAGGKNVLGAIAKLKSMRN